jgi:hypothetical protein
MDRLDRHDTRIRVRERVDPGVAEGLRLRAPRLYE